jgi:hypothetical protein
MPDYISILIILFFNYIAPQSDSPHGEKLKLDCSSCHTSNNWDYNKNSTFSHDITKFPLEGQHKIIDCRSCHKSLKFNEAPGACYSCHEDIHQQSVGNDCQRCHNSGSWIISDIFLIHERVSFPLTGVHTSVNCDECHKNEQNLIFGPVGVECFDCHKSDYLSAKSPDHQQQQFSTDCSQCHSIHGPEWNSGRILHSFFPLQQAHDIDDCKVCHKTENYNDLSGECISCHQNDFMNAKNPDHSLFPTECELCHTLNPGWKPATFGDHDSRFPIYSGNHKNEWDNCIDCHTQSGNFTLFSCINCHEHSNQSKLANEHDEVKDYKFDSNACLECHPKGKED